MPCPFLPIYEYKYLCAGRSVASCTVSGFGGQISTSCNIAAPDSPRWVCVLWLRAALLLASSAGWILLAASRHFTFAAQEQATQRGQEAASIRIGSTSPAMLLCQHRGLIIQLLAGALVACCFPVRAAAAAVPLLHAGAAADPSANYVITGMFQLDDDGGDGSAACSRAPPSSHAHQASAAAV